MEKKFTVHVKIEDLDKQRFNIEAKESLSEDGDFNKDELAEFG
jgi:hypothetical protein